ELCAYFGVRDVDDLAETARREFIRLAKMSDDDRAEVLASKGTAPPIGDELKGNAANGFPVFPLKAGTKDTPVGPPTWRRRFPKGQYFDLIPSSDQEMVARMWTSAAGQSLDCNIGICTNDLLVFDLDNKGGKNGVQAFEQLRKELELPRTVEAVTP